MWSILKKILGIKDQEQKIPDKVISVSVPQATQNNNVTQTNNTTPVSLPAQPKKDDNVAQDTNGHGTPVSPDWQYLWDNCVVDLKAKKMLDDAVNIFVKNRQKYIDVQNKNGVPDWFVAGLHMRECGFDFSQCLHNGDPWNRVTTHVPRGRGPWSSWSEAALDALAFDGITYEKVNTIAKALEYAFRFNGIGYKTKIGDHKTVEYSPYVAAYTNWHDETSKYTGDGKYDPNAKEQQLGVMAFWKELSNRGLINVK